MILYKIVYLYCIISEKNLVGGNTNGDGNTSEDGTTSGDGNTIKASNTTGNKNIVIING